MTPANQQKFKNDLSALQSGIPAAVALFNKDFGYLFQSESVKSLPGYGGARNSFQAKRYTDQAFTGFFKSNLANLPDPGAQ